ncbi:MAG: hypothetical protein AABM67_20445 [Acidobacteriota bacterium]
MTKSNRLRIVALLLGLYVIVPAIVSGQNPSHRTVRPAALDQGTLDLFAGYPENENLKLVIYTHARREPMEGAEVALYSTWFLHGNPRGPMTTIVDIHGRVFTYPKPLTERDRTRSLWKEQPAVDLTLFLATIRTLPVSTPPIAMGDLVIVSYRLDGKWETRLYDRTKTPPELATIYQLAHSVLHRN